MRKNGCHNRPPLKEWVTVQSGHYATDNFTRHDCMVTIPDPMTKPCQYTLTDLGQTDPGCIGCSWKTQSGARAPQ